MNYVLHSKINGPPIKKKSRREYLIKNDRKDIYNFFIVTYTMYAVITIISFMINIGLFTNVEVNYRIIFNSVLVIFTILLQFFVGTRIHKRHVGLHYKDEISSRVYLKISQIIPVFGILAVGFYALSFTLDRFMIVSCISYTTSAFLILFSGIYYTLTCLKNKHNNKIVKKDIYIDLIISIATTIVLIIQSLATSEYM